MLRARHHYLHSTKGDLKHKLIADLKNNNKSNRHELEKASKRLSEVEQIIRITCEGASELQSQYLYEKCSIIMKLLRNVFNMLSRSILQSVCKANRLKSAKQKTLYGSLPIFKDCLVHLEKMKAKLYEFCAYAQSLIAVMSDTISLVQTSCESLVDVK